MKRYLLLYKAFLRANFAELITYRANFLNNVLSSTLWGCVSIIVMVLLTSRTQSVFGWSRNEMLLLTGLANIFVSVFYFLFSRNFDRFSQIIHTGRLDSVLLKPVDSQFLMSFSYISFSGPIRIVIGLAFTVYILAQMNYMPSVFALLGAIILLGCSIILMYSCWYIVSTLLIWWTNLSNLSGLLYEFNTLTRFPQQMYQPIKILLYVILPLTLVITVPVRTLVGKFDIPNVILLVLFSGIFFIASRLFWKFALRFYTSASG